MQMEVVLSFIRQAFLFGGGLLVGQGILTAGQIELLSGAIITIVPAVWGLVSKWQDQQKIAKLLDDKSELKAENKDLKQGFTGSVNQVPPPGGWGA